MSAVKLMLIALIVLAGDVLFYWAGKLRGKMELHRDLLIEAARRTGQTREALAGLKNKDGN